MEFLYRACLENFEKSLLTEFVIGIPEKIERFFRAHLEAYFVSRKILDNSHVNFLLNLGIVNLSSNLFTDYFFLFLAIEQTAAISKRKLANWESPRNEFVENLLGDKIIRGTWRSRFKITDSTSKNVDGNVTRWRSIVVNVFLSLWDNRCSTNPSSIYSIIVWNSRTYDNGED